MDKNQQLYHSFIRPDGMLRLVKLDMTITADANSAVRYSSDMTTASQLNGLEFFDNPVKEQIILGGYY